MARQVEITKDFINELREAIRQDSERLALQLMEDLHAVDIAAIYDELTIEEARFLYLLLEPELAADVLAELEEDDVRRFTEALPADVLARQFIDGMDSDDAADVIGEMTEDKKQEVLQHISDADQAGDIVDLLAYDEDTAGGLMAKEMIRVEEDWTILTCLKELGRQADEVDEVYYVYVVNEDGLLVGVVSLKQMLLHHNSTKIRNILEPDIIRVDTSTPSEEVAHIMDKYDLVAVPVVDSIGRLVGRITIDDVVDVIREEAERDYQMASGLTEDVESSDKVIRITRARLPWLMIGLLGGIFGALVLGHFEGTLKINPEMAFFIPLIGAMGGNVGIQSSAIIVQSLAAATLRLESTWKKLSKEFLVALLNGSILAALIFLYNFIFSDSFALTVTVSAALLAVIIFAALFGTLIPLMLNRLKIDPALATGPFITTMNDIMGLAVYMIMGRFLYTIFL